MSDNEWRPIETAPRSGPIILLLGESIPDLPYIRVGEFITRSEITELHWGIIYLSPEIERKTK